MPKTMYACELCLALYNTRKEARQCESEHPALETLSIKDVSADKVRVKSDFPNRITVASTNGKPEMVGIYHLKEVIDEIFWEDMKK